jgi:hypothetical protein
LMNRLEKVEEKVSQILLLVVHLECDSWVLFRECIHGFRIRAF